ncbi:MAG: hypothetical protein IJ869_05130 [Clostridiales bacterium]|nr:hypothetical protein [Clostridiales bacterium]
MGKKSEQKKKITPGAVCLIAALVLLYSPFFNIIAIAGYNGDTMIQTKIGLDMIAQKRLILTDIYSWHEGLNWYPHEEGWYFLLGAAYKIFGLFGIIGVAAAINYAIAGVAFRKDYKEGIHPLIILLNAAIARFLAFPNYVARPGLISMIVIAFFLLIMLSEKPVLFKAVSFITGSFIISWMHGGMIPFFYLIMLILIVLELVYKNFRDSLFYLGALLIGFATSLLNPIGFKIWEFGLIQSKSTDIWELVEEWNPKHFSIPEITLILLLLLGFAVNDKMRKFDKATVTKMALLCMFIIISCRYCRFMYYVAVMVILFGAEQYSCLIDWINTNVLKIKKENIHISDFSYYLITAFAICFAIFNIVTSVTSYFPTNSMSDISALSAFDEDAAKFIKDKGYSRIYNSFNTGAWLTFYDVKVHIDNRIDPYLAEFSGEDHIRGKMQIADLDDMDEFVEEYHPDAVLIELDPDYASYLIEDYEGSGRYKLVYDNTLTSTYDPDITIRWLVFEVIY